MVIFVNPTVDSTLHVHACLYVVCDCMEVCVCVCVCVCMNNDISLIRTLSVVPATYVHREVYKVTSEIRTPL